MRFRLAEMMKERRVTQAQIAEGLGVARQVVNNWLAGRKKDGQEVPVFPNAETLEDLCLFLECTPNDLLEIEQETTKSGKTWRDFYPTVRRGGRLVRDE